MARSSQSLAAGLLVVGPRGPRRDAQPGRTSDAPCAGRHRRTRLSRVPQRRAGPAGADRRAALQTASPVSRRRIPWSRGEVGTQLAVSVSPLSAADRTSEGAICLFSDLTADVELEEQLRLKEALARGRAHGGHRARVPQRPRDHSWLQPADSPRRSAPAYRPYVDGIRQETEALGHVVTNFLKFARPSR